jgi:hypothetical protein
MIPVLALSQTHGAPDNSASVDSSSQARAMGDTLESEPPIGFVALQLDTGTVDLSGYGSFADVIDALPAIFHFNGGSIGQLATASLFAAPSKETLLQYDDLILNDPLTGLCDLNLIPVEQIAQVKLLTDPKERFWGFQTLGQVIQIVPSDISNIPIRSRITYRTGYNNYDDFDAMLGIRFSPRTDFNCGGLLKSYGGLSTHGDYKAQKIRGRLVRKIGESGEIRYSFLFNRFDLEEYLPYDDSSSTIAVQPHQKDLRYDHALTFEGNAATNKFRVSLQHTRLYREFYDYHADIEELYEPDAIRFTSEWQGLVWRFRLMAGGHVFVNNIRSKEDEGFLLFEGREWTGARLGIGKIFDVEMLSKVIQRNGHSPVLTHAATFNYRPNERWRLQLLMSRNYDYPGPMELGYPVPVLAETWDQRPQKTLAVTALVGYDSPKLSIFGSVSDLRVEDRLVTSQSENGMDFVNLPLETRLGLSGSVHYRPSEWIGLWLKGLHYAAESLNSNYHLLDFPENYIASHVALSGRFFKDDLFATLHLGAKYFGQRRGYRLWTGEYNGEHMRLEKVVVPFVRVVFIIDNVKIFLSMQNLIGTEYEVLYGYPMPGRDFRWGLSWCLVD